jgi:hypothetical protein
MTSLPSSAVVPSSRGFWLGVAGYLIPSFPIAYAWHLVWFAPSYDALGIYRPDPIIPFGLVSMLIQGVIFSLAYPRFFPDSGGAVLRPGLLYGAGLAILSWSFTTLAVAAKNIMGSVPTYIVLETGFTVLQFVVVGPLIALAYRR